MKSSSFLLQPILLLLLSALAASAEPKVTIAQNENDKTSAQFKFTSVPSPVKNDAASEAVFTLLSGARDGNGADLGVLHDGKLPAEEDQPKMNFFLGVGTNAGRLKIDLGKVISVKQVNTYSWHPNTRGPQVYKVFAASGDEPQFNPTPTAETNLKSAGWRAIADVNTKRADRETGGQHAVSISGSDGPLGRFRYLILEISTSDYSYPYANTFFSEIDVIDADGPADLPPAATDQGGPGKFLVQAGDGKYEITIDTSETPDLREWAEKELAPVVKEWYPKLVEMLPSPGYNPPAQVNIFFGKDLQGVAFASGNRIRCAARWFRDNLEGEAKGAVVHELVHVVQQYGRARRNNPNASRPPGWLVEGIPDYIRWFLYEPQTKGAEITARNLSRAKYDANYRISGNFLNWVVNKYDRELVRKLNALLREGAYNEEIWKTSTGKTVQELGDEWLAMHKEKIGVDAAGQ